MQCDKSSAFGNCVCADCVELKLVLTAGAAFAAVNRILDELSGSPVPGLGGVAGVEHALCVLEGIANVAISNAKKKE